jgi:hypothetical protein
LPAPFAGIGLLKNYWKLHLESSRFHLEAFVLEPLTVVGQLHWFQQRLKVPVEGPSERVSVEGFERKLTLLFLSMPKSPARLGRLNASNCLGTPWCNL